MVKILEVNPQAPEMATVMEAAAVLRGGKLVVYPTETVYGLGADALSDEAVAKVFEAKARPLEDPISVAVSSLEMARTVGTVTPTAEPLFEKFLPGPLTVIVEAKPAVSKLVSAGTGKVGIRIPDHRVTLRLIELVGGPITSTSANLSGEPAPPTARAAIEQLGDKVDVALDSGKCRFCAPSTVVDATAASPKVIREGPISSKKIASALKG